MIPEINSIKPSIFNLVKGYAHSIKDGRKPLQVLGKQMEELGEMATEVNISQGYLKKPPGKDGVIGEAADVLITTLDQALLERPDLTEEEFYEVVHNKLNKWFNMQGTPAEGDVNG